jgi:hypothetical protein
MVKIKVEGQGVYIKEAEWDAYKKGEKVENSAAILTKTMPSR